MAMIAPRAPEPRSPDDQSWGNVHFCWGVSPDVPAGSVAVVPEVPSSWPVMPAGNLHVGTAEVTGAQGLALTIGTVLAAGARVHSVTLNGAHLAYHLVTTHRGTAVEVPVPRPPAAEVLAVEA
jgi:hypothetical protein